MFKFGLGLGLVVCLAGFLWAPIKEIAWIPEQHAGTISAVCLFIGVAGLWWCASHGEKTFYLIFETILTLPTNFIGGASLAIWLINS